MQERSASWWRRAWRAAWRTRLFRLTLVLALLAVLTDWPWWLAIPAVVYASRGIQWVLDRILYSTRAKLVAFYLNAALLPFLFVGVVVAFGGYLVLSHVSAQVVERRLQARAMQLERQAAGLEKAYWQLRAAGVDPRSAATQAVTRPLTLPPERSAVWVLDDAGELLAARGDAAFFAPWRPAWLRGARWAGLASRDDATLEVRARLMLEPGSGAAQLGVAWRLQTADLNPRSAGADSMPAMAAPLRIATGPTAGGAATLADSGVVALLAPERGGASGDSDSTATAAAVSQPEPLRSRLPTLAWVYFAHPVDWATGSTVSGGPPITVRYSVEGASRALLRTSAGVSRLIWIVALNLLVFFAILATLTIVRGVLYARAITDAVARLDAGVRAIRRGDFGARIEPRERDQLGHLALEFNDMAARMQGLLEERAAAQAFERELDIARAVQRRLFPEGFPRDPGLECAGVCLPARVVSGDYYDVIPLDGGGYDLVVADVSGKGISAALLMASVQAALRSQYAGPEVPEPDEVMVRLNRHLHAYAEPTRFVTMFLVRYRPGKPLEYANAGHNPAVWLHDGRVDWLRDGGLILGPFEEVQVPTVRVAADPGDAVCLYTDGVTEALSPSGEQYGEERLVATLARLGGRSASAIEAGLVDSVARWRGDAEASDDVTVVVLRLQSVDAAAEVSRAP